MKIFIPTKDRWNTITTHKLFPNALVVTHNQEQADKYLTPPHVIKSDTDPDAYGLTRQREWVCENYADKDEWILFADDNIKELWAIPKWAYDQNELLEIIGAAGHPDLARIVNKYREKHERVMSPDIFLSKVVPECIAKAEKVGAYMVGFSVTDNPLFRTRKWGTTSYVSGKMFLYRTSSGMSWDHTITMEDFRNSAWQLLHHGRVVINRYIHPRAVHYQPGGMGTAQQRIPYREKDMIKLMQKFPGLFRVKQGTYPDLALRLHGEKSIDRWREELLVNR